MKKPPRDASGGRNSGNAAQNRLWRFADMQRAGADQFVLAAVAVEHADRLHAVVFGADDVVAAVTDHQRFSGIDGNRLQRVCQKIRLVDAPAVEVGTEYMFEV